MRLSKRRKKKRRSKSESSVGLPSGHRPGPQLQESIHSRHQMLYRAGGLRKCTEIGTEYVSLTSLHSLPLSLSLSPCTTTAGLEKFPNDKDLKQGHNRVEIIRNKLERIEKKLGAVSLKYDSFFESHLKPRPPPTATEDAKDEKSENENNPYSKVEHKLAKDDEKDVDIALSMIQSLLSNDLSQSINLKCTNIRALIIKQNYDSALSTATNVLRWNKDNNDVMKLRAIALFRNGSTDSAIKHLQVEIDPIHCW